MAPNVTNYVRSFVNPLLAQAFKDGIDYVGDPDFRALEPKKEGDMWEVIIEHDVDDDDDEDDADEVITPMGPIPVKNYSKTANSVTPGKTIPLSQLTLKDYEARFDKMKPRPITATGKDEIIHPPVKVEEVKTESGSVVKLYMPTEPNNKEPEPQPPPPKPAQNIGYNQSAIEGIAPCNSCLNCAHGETCINIINAACLASMPT